MSRRRNHFWRQVPSFKAMRQTRNATLFGDSKHQLNINWCKISGSWVLLSVIFQLCSGLKWKNINFVIVDKRYISLYKVQTSYKNAGWRTKMTAVYDGCREWRPIMFLTWRWLRNISRQQYNVFLLLWLLVKIIIFLIKVINFNKNLLLQY